MGNYRKWIECNASVVAWVNNPVELPLNLDLANNSYHRYLMDEYAKHMIDGVKSEEKKRHVYKFFEGKEYYHELSFFAAYLILRKSKSRSEIAKLLGISRYALHRIAMKDPRSRQAGKYPIGVISAIHSIGINVQFDQTFIYHTPMQIFQMITSLKNFDANEKPESIPVPSLN